MPRAWPHAAQLAAAFLLGAAFALLGVRLVQGNAGRPLDVSRAPPIDLNRAARMTFCNFPASVRSSPAASPTHVMPAAGSNRRRFADRFPA